MCDYRNTLKSSPFKCNSKSYLQQFTEIRFSRHHLVLHEFIEFFLAFLNEREESVRDPSEWMKSKTLTRSDDENLP